MTQLQLDCLVVSAYCNHLESSLLLMQLVTIQLQSLVKVVTRYYSITTCASNYYLLQASYYQCNRLILVENQLLLICNLAIAGCNQLLVSCNQVVQVATSNQYQLQSSYCSSCNLITTSCNLVTFNQLLHICKSTATVVATRITNEPNYRDQMQIVHIVATR